MLRFAQHDNFEERLTVRCITSALCDFEGFERFREWQHPRLCVPNKYFVILSEAKDLLSPAPCCIATRVTLRASSYTACLSRP